MSRTLSGLFLVGALNRPRKRKRTNRENPRTIPEQIGKIPEKSGKSKKGRKRTKKEGQVQIGKPPRLKPPRLAALEIPKSTRLHELCQEVCAKNFCLLPLGGFQQPLTRILLHKYPDTNGSRIVIQIGGVYATFCQEEGTLLQKHRGRNGRCIAMLFESIGERGRFGSPDSL